MVIAEDSSLEYHFESDREPTAAMKTIAELVEAADSHLESGKRAEAIAVLQSACDLEPPPLVYEMLEKRLYDLKRDLEPPPG